MARVEHYGAHRSSASQPPHLQDQYQSRPASSGQPRASRLRTSPPSMYHPGSHPSPFRVERLVGHGKVVDNLHDWGTLVSACPRSSRQAEGEGDSGHGDDDHAGRRKAEPSSGQPAPCLALDDAREATLVTSRRSSSNNLRMRSRASPQLSSGILCQKVVIGISAQGSSAPPSSRAEPDARVACAEEPVRSANGYDSDRERRPGRSHCSDITTHPSPTAASTPPGGAPRRARRFSLLGPAPHRSRSIHLAVSSCARAQRRTAHSSLTALRRGACSCARSQRALDPGPHICSGQIQ